MLGHGDTKSSVLLAGGFQADLRLVAADSRGAALQYFTGSKAHNIALRDRAIGLGLKLNEYGLFRVDDDERVAGERRGGDLRGARPRTGFRRSCARTAARSRPRPRSALPRLITRADLRGDLHMHTTETDGKDDIADDGARRRARRGLEYIAITDHSQSLAMANGLDERARARARRAHPRASTREGLGIRLLAGIECDILPDGSLDLADDCLAALDIVVASVHSAFNQDRQRDDRPRAAGDREPARRHPRPPDRPHAAEAAGRIRSTSRRSSTRPAAAGVALEINSQPHRLDLNDVHAGWRATAACRSSSRATRTRAHALGYLRWGVAVARRAWLQPADVLNTRPFDDFRALAAPAPEMRAHEAADAQRRRQASPRSGGSISRRRKQTIQEDLAKALDLLKSMASEEERERATVYMEGLAQMRTDWGKSRRLRAKAGGAERNG